jgi:hypothetical protein
MIRWHARGAGLAYYGVHGADSPGLGRQAVEMPDYGHLMWNRNLKSVHQAISTLLGKPAKCTGGHRVQVVLCVQPDGAVSRLVDPG